MLNLEIEPPISGQGLGSDLLGARRAPFLLT